MCANRAASVVRRMCLIVRLGLTAFAELVYGLDDLVRCDDRGFGAGVNVDA